MSHNTNQRDTKHNHPKKKIADMTTYIVAYKAGQAKGIFMVGPDQYLVFMDTAKDLNDFGDEYSAIKNAVVDAQNRDFERKPSSAAAQVRKLQKEWIPKVMLFVRRWGKEYVLGDLRAVINDTEGSLGMEITRWPEFVEAN